MTSAFKSIAQGLKEAIDLNDGQKVAAKIHRDGKEVVRMKDDIFEQLMNKE